MPHVSIAAPLVNNIMSEVIEDSRYRQNPPASSDVGPTLAGTPHMSLAQAIDPYRYTDNGSAMTFTTAGTGYGISVDGTIKRNNTIKPEWYFKILKKKFNVLETRRLKKHLKDLTKAFETVVDNKQTGLGEKIMRSVIVITKELAMSVKGIKYYVTYDDAHKYKKNLKTGHISDTRFEQYTRIIPKKVLAKKKKVESVFDGFVIFHYWNDAQKDVKNMSQEEKNSMKDPILFGYINETNKLYFVADWIDELCELTFSEMVSYLAKTGKRSIESIQKEITIPGV